MQIKKRIFSLLKKYKKIKSLIGFLNYNEHPGTRTHPDLVWSIAALQASSEVNAFLASYNVVLIVASSIFAAL